MLRSLRCPFMAGAAQKRAAPTTPKENLTNLKTIDTRTSNFQMRNIKIKKNLKSQISFFKVWNSFRFVAVIGARARVEPETPNGEAWSRSRQKGGRLRNCRNTAEKSQLSNAKSYNDAFTL